MPSIIRQNYKNLIVRNLDNILAKFNISGFVISNLADLELLPNTPKYKVIGNYTLNVFNNHTVHELKGLNISTITLSPELSKMALTDNFPYSTELMVYGNYKEAVRRNIKEYLSSYYTHNSANWLTKVRKVETEKPQSGGSMENGNGSSEQEKVYVFDFSSCAIIKGNNYVFEGGEDIISGINFIYANLDKGDVVVSDEKNTYCFYIIKSKAKRSYEPNDYLANVKVKLDLILKEVIATENSNFSVTDVEPSPEVSELVKNYVKGTIEKAFNECKSKDVDIFNLYEGFYGKMGKEWLEMENDYLKKSKINVEVKLSFY
jgi:hypothetical protein